MVAPTLIARRRAKSIKTTTQLKPQRKGKRKNKKQKKKKKTKTKKRTLTGVILQYHHVMLGHVSSLPKRN
jgi:hypothetical protein